MKPFTIQLVDGSKLEVEAAGLFVDGGTLVLLDQNSNQRAAFCAGHWLTALPAAGPKEVK